MLAFGALVWAVFLLGRECFGWPVGALAAFTLATREPVPVAGDARLRGHPVPGAGGRRRGARGAPAAARRAGAGAARRWPDCCARRPGCWPPPTGSTCCRALAAAGALRGSRALVVAAPLIWAVSDLAITGDALHSLTFTRDTAETLGRPQGIENVPEVMPRRLGEILRWVPLVGGTAGFFLALRFARERAAGARRAGGARWARVRGDRDRRPVAARAATCSCRRRCCAIFFGFAALGWIGRPLDGAWRAWMGGAAVLLVAFVGSTVSHQTDRLDRPARRHPAARRDPGRPARPDPGRRGRGRCSSAARRVYVPNHRAVPILAWYLDRAPGGLPLRAARARRAGACTSRPAPMSWRRSSSSTRATRSGSRSRAGRPASGPWPPTSRGRSTSAGASSAIQVDRAPVFENGPPGVSAAIRLRPGGSAAHGEDRLRLLPSGSDLVHGTPSRGTWPSTPSRGVLALKAEPSDGNSAPLERIAGYRAPLAPRLARSSRQL